MLSKKITFSLIAGLLMTTLNQPAFSLTIEELKKCEAHDIALLQKQTNFYSMGRISMLSGSGFRENILNGKFNPREEPYKTYSKIVSAAKTCSEISSNKRISSDYDKQVADHKKYQNRKSKEILSEISERLKAAGLIRASETITLNEFLLGLEISFSDLAAAFGNKNRETLYDKLSTLYPDLAEAQRKAYETYEAEMEALYKLPENAEGIYETDPKLLAIEERHEKIQEDLGKQIDARLAKLTAQEIETRLLYNLKQETIRSWEEMNQ